MSDRYKVVEGSQSAHCCFDFTVVDSTQPYMIGDKQCRDEFIAVCECFTREDADLICRALNGQALPSQFPVEEKS